MSIQLLHYLKSTFGDPESSSLAQFLEELTAGAVEKRAHERVPLHRQITLYFDDDPMPSPGFMRDISEAGVGIIHDFMIPLGEATIRMASNSGKTLCARVNILWCRETRRHCYISGGTFVRVFAEDPIEL